MPARRNNALLSVLKCRQLPTIRCSTGRGADSGSALSRRITSVISTADRDCRSVSRLSGTSNPYAFAHISWTISPRTARHNPTGSVGSPSKTSAGTPPRSVIGPGAA